MAVAKAPEMSNPFAILCGINVNEHTEQKNGLTYLSWAWAWDQVKRSLPDRKVGYTIYERDTDLGPVNYFTDGKTCWVKTGVSIDDEEYIEELPVMDFKNRSIPLEQVTSMDVNKAIQRSLTKACARHGLGLYIYAGEDLPEESEEEKLARKQAEEQHATRVKGYIEQIDGEVKRLCTGMSREEKVNFANTRIQPVIGQLNYKACEDEAKLKKLAESLQAA